MFLNGKHKVSVDGLKFKQLGVPVALDFLHRWTAIKKMKWYSNVYCTIYMYKQHSDSSLHENRLSTLLDP